MFTLWNITVVLFLLTLSIKGYRCSEICERHNSPWGVTYHRCENGCCGTLYDRHCCIDRLTMTVVLSVLGGGIGIAIIVAIVWYFATAKKRSKVGPDSVPVMKQTEAA